MASFIRRKAGGLLETERRVYPETTARNNLPGPSFTGTCIWGRCRSWRFGETRRPLLQKVTCIPFTGKTTVIVEGSFSANLVEV